MIATPRSRSIVHGMPSPTPPASGRASTRRPQLALERLEQLVLASGPMLGAVDAVERRGGRSPTTPTSIFVPPEVDADRLNRQREPLRVDDLPGRPCGSIDQPMPTDGRGRGERPERPDYKVYRSRPGLFSRLRSPDLSKLREQEGAQGRRRRRRATEAAAEPRSSERAAVAPGAPKWVGIAALAWIAAQLPRLRDLLADPEVEARRHGQHPARQPVPGGQPADDPRDRHRHPLGPVRRPRRGGVEELPRCGRERQAAAVQLHRPTAPTR